MAIRKIVTEGDEVLHKMCRNVEKFDKRLAQLIDDMKETLIESGGVGLAAPQVGILRRVVLVDDGEKILELVNPVITESRGEQIAIEGCLSCPGEYGYVKRPAVVTVEAFDRDGYPVKYTGEKLTARCFCHEIDHLNGHLFKEKARMLNQRELDHYLKGAED